MNIKNYQNCDEEILHLSNLASCLHQISVCPKKCSSLLSRTRRYSSRKG